MKDWFDDKVAQVNVSAVTAFDVELFSRHSNARELSEMLAFANLAARRRLQHHVKSVFYDTNSNCCSFTFNSRIREGDAIEQDLLEAATETISQFEWFGVVHHGGAMAGAEEEMLKDFLGTN